MPDNPNDAADYIATTLRELKALAKSHRLDTLAYLIEMAELEATAKAPKDDPR